MEMAAMTDMMTIATMIPIVMSRAFMISFRGQSVVLRRESNPFLPDVNRFRRKKSDFLPLSRTFSGKTLTFTGNGSIIHTVPNHSQRRLYHVRNQRNLRAGNSGFPRQPDGRSRSRAGVRRDRDRRRAVRRFDRGERGARTARRRQEALRRQGRPPLPTSTKKSFRNSKAWRRSTRSASTRR